jgi:hypothetical protein
MRAIVSTGSSTGSNIQDTPPATEPPSARPKRELTRFPVLDGFRGFAAVGIVIVHYSLGPSLRFPWIERMMDFWGDVSHLSGQLPHSLWFSDRHRFAGNERLSDLLLEFLSTPRLPHLSHLLLVDRHCRSYAPPWSLLASLLSFISSAAQDPCLRDFFPARSCANWGKSATPCT